MPILTVSSARAVEQSASIDASNVRTICLMRFIKLLLFGLCLNAFCGSGLLRFSNRPAMEPGGRHLVRPHRPQPRQPLRPCNRLIPSKCDAHTHGAHQVDVAVARGGGFVELIHAGTKV